MPERPGPLSADEERVLRYIADGGKYVIAPAGKGERAVTLGNIFATLDAARAESAALRRERDEEVAEFSAGYDCAKAGGSLKDEPNHCPHDQWVTGFKFGDYDRLARQLEEARAALLREGIRTGEIERRASALREALVRVKSEMAPRLARVMSGEAVDGGHKWLAANFDESLDLMATIDRVLALDAEPEK